MAGGQTELVFSEESSLGGLRDYCRIFEAQYEAISAALGPVVRAHRVLGPMVAAMPREVVEAEGRASLERLRQAILEGAWGPYEQRHREDGARYAKLGVRFQDWLDLVSLADGELVPRLIAAYGAEPTRLSAALRAMQALHHRTLALIGEQFLETREEALRANEQNLQVAATLDAIFENLPDMVFLKDAEQLRFQRFNRAGEELLGWPREELLGKNDFDFFPREQAEFFVAKDRETLQHGRVVEIDEPISTRLKGPRILHTKKVAIRDQTGKPVFLLGISQDVTEQQKAQQAIIEANRQKSEFLANMSHELRTPLNAVIGFAELLHDGRVTDRAKQKEFLGDILTSGRHLLRLINDVLDLSKVEAGKMVFHPEPVELADVIREVTAVLAPTAAAKHIQVETSIAELGSVVIDAARLKQVLYNYLSNALKFTPPGGRVAVRIVGEGTGSFRLEVEDTGTGIAPTDRDRLFQEFQQLQAGPSKNHAGTGLGLALTKRLVEAQSGTVGVEGTPGKGSRFFAVLPRKSTGAAILPFKSSRRAAPGAPTILVVEDDPGDQQALSEILLSAGYEIQIAATGAEAIALAGQRPYDAITLDLILPDMSGLDVLRSIRVAGPNAHKPVVVATVVAENVTRAFSVTDCLRKPLQSDALLGTLRRAGVVPGIDRSVLVVDDDPVSLKLMAETLEHMDYRVVCRSDGARGLQEAFSLKPAAVILDLVMPGVDGFEFLKRFRAVEANRRVPVIVWTSKDLTAADLDRLRASAVGVIPKSTAADELLEELELCLWDAASLASARKDT